MHIIEGCASGASITASTRTAQRGNTLRGHLVLSLNDIIIFLIYNSPTMCMLPSMWATAATEGGLTARSVPDSDEPRGVTAELIIDAKIAVTTQLRPRPPSTSSIHPSNRDVLVKCAFCIHGSKDDPVGSCGAVSCRHGMD